MGQITKSRTAGVKECSMKMDKEVVLKVLFTCCEFHLFILWVTLNDF